MQQISLQLEYNKDTVHTILSKREVNSKDDDQLTWPGTGPQFRVIFITLPFLINHDYQLICKMDPRTLQRYIILIWIWSEVKS